MERINPNRRLFIFLIKKISTMITDKEFTLRLIRQLTQALEKLILDKPEESLMQKELDFETLMRDIFKFDFTTLSSKSKEEIIEIVNERQERDHKDYYEMLGNLFYFTGRGQKNNDFLDKAKTFYELYLQTSGIFALPVINRINEIKKALE
jgi:predicted house-cleaning noncanonical NTP pyrophosphatase (MazG superfamily)